MSPKYYGTFSLQCNAANASMANKIKSANIVRVLKKKKKTFNLNLELKKLKKCKLGKSARVGSLIIKPLPNMADLTVNPVVSGSTPI